MADQATGLLSPWLRSQRLRAVRPYITGRVLDFGCGIGLLAPMCDAKGYFGVDIDAESIAEARRRHPEYAFGVELPAHGSFDRIIMLALIEHVRQLQALLTRLRGYLAPGGQIIMTTPHRRFQWVHALAAKVGICSAEADDEHETLFDREMMRSTVESAGLSLLRSGHFLFGMNQLFIVEPKAAAAASRSNEAAVRTMAEVHS